MRRGIKYKRCMLVRFIQVALITIGMNVLFTPSYKPIVSEDNYYVITLNGVEVGATGSDESVDDYLLQARKRIAIESENIQYIPIDLIVNSTSVMFAKIDSSKDIIDAMVNVMANSINDNLQQAYTVKVNDYTVNLSDSEQVVELILAATGKYDTMHEYGVELLLDKERELNVLTANVHKILFEDKESPAIIRGGAELYVENALDKATAAGEKSFDDYDYGLMDIDLGVEVEIVEAYVNKNSISGLDKAIKDLTVEQDTQKIYEVKSGDTLSEISIQVGIPLEELISINPTLENENSIIKIGDELIITVPEPELTVVRTELLYYEEDYDEEVIYVPNDNWYTTDKVVLQQPSGGKRKVAAVINFKNNEEVGRDIIKEDLVVEAVAKIVERGTKIPPTYIKPLSGGRLSSMFGKRRSPGGIGSTNHKGIDWATPTGTAIKASCGGVVQKAGWGSGYGYVVFIKHPDGRETRYGHLSRTLVSAGQSVSQGEKIGLSGNTGNSTGPHLHFEIRIGGTAVDPLKYLE